MTGDTGETDTSTTSEDLLPGWLERYAVAGPYALAVGVLLCVLALFTNPTPDPSFPWYSLPESYLFPVAQPRVEHWPVSYSVGVWLWVGFAPAVFLRAYQIDVPASFGSATWLLGLPAGAMLALTTYCRFFWPKLHPATWNAPAYSFLCWAYCSTYDPLWSDLAYAVAALGVLAFALLRYRASSAAVAVEAAFGVLALPLGLPAVFDAYRRHAGA